MPSRRPKAKETKKSSAATPKRRRGAALWTAASAAPLAIALGVGSPGASTKTAAATGTVVASTNLIAATDAIKRVSLDSPAEEVGEAWEKPAPNKVTLGACPWYGTAGSDSVTNKRKNRSDLPSSYHAVTFDAIASLDWPHEASTDRRHWTDAESAEIAPYEGEGVSVTGFIVALRPQKGNSESTNCGETPEDSTDWHMALVGKFGDPESKAIVVEPTPRIKLGHPNWVPTALKGEVGKKDSVRVSGYLLLDPVHKNHLGKYRQTLWEVHPVHRIELFQNGKWRDLDGS